MRTPFGLSLFVLLSASVSALAKPPVLDGLFPPGGRRGETVTVTAAGSFGQWPVKVWTEDQAIAVTPLPEKAKLSIAVAPDASVGVHWLRLFDDDGATAIRPFMVGTLPEVVETEPNDDPRKPQRLESAAVTINGKLARSGDVDGYAVTLQKGQTLVAAMEANRHLGAPMDGVLQIVSGDGFVLADNDDAPDRDPLIVFNAPADGAYLVRAFAFPAEPDAAIRFSGGESFVYRLTLTTGGFLDHVYPLAVSRAGPARVEAAGWNILESARWLEVAVPGANVDHVVIDHPLLAGACAVRLEPWNATVETEPNTREQPQEIALPITITGRIDPPRDQDAFQFVARKGETWLIQVASRGLGHPLDPVLKVLDASGKVLTEMDDPGSRRRSATRDPELTFTAPADAAYRIVVGDLHGQGSFRHVYRLSAAAPTVDYVLAVTSDQFTLAPGKPLKVPVSVTRNNGFGGTVEVSIEGAGLPASLAAPRVTSAPSGESAKSVSLELSTPEGSWTGPVRIIGKVAGEDEEVRAAATLAAFNTTTRNLWLTISKPAATTKDAAPDKSK
jgi:hypothetical protein